MQSAERYIPRDLEVRVREGLERFPAVAILGPRQAGKSTLARRVASGDDEAVHLDLEYPPDRDKLTDPALYFESRGECLICLDEIQRMPELFPVLRSVIDRRGRNGQFLILGSASPELLRQSSESLAGRLVYFELSPFLVSELAGDSPSLRRLWTRGGFARSYLAADEDASLQWRRSFIATFLERDIPQLGTRVPAETLRRLWSMLAHNHGQLLNASRLGESLGLSHTTVRSHIDLLQRTFMVRVLPPLLPNLKKRLVKSPKTFIRDPGILLALLGLGSYDELLGHPVFGASWEGLCIENLCAALPHWQASFYRTSDGTEIDLILEKGDRRLAFEFKASLTPKVTRAFHNAVADVAPERTWTVYPGSDSYPLTADTQVIGLPDLLTQLKTGSAYA